MKDFAAIDFETANPQPQSVCSVGVVVVRNGAIADRFYELIRPTPNYYSSWTTQIHGLDYHDTVDSDPFPQVWERVAPLIDGLPLVAHYSPFDEGCLRQAYQHYGMTWPGYHFFCTCRMARQAFPHLPNHRLPTVAAHIGFSFTRHHHALADAEACAEIAIKLF